jgi:lysozyme family protein
VSRFDICLKIVLRHEGGWSNNPIDPGRATNKGITLATLRRWRGKATNAVHLRNITNAEVERIYASLYWTPMFADLLPTGVDLLIFDGAVNQGITRTSKVLQRALKSMGQNVIVDGVVGQVTIRAVGKVNAYELIHRIAARRIYQYGLLTTLYKTFGLGWSRRVASVLADAVSQAKED